MVQKFITTDELSNGFSFVYDKYGNKPNFDEFDKYLYSNKKLFKEYQNLVTKSYKLWYKDPEDDKINEINGKIMKLLEDNWNKFNNQSNKKRFRAYWGSGYINQGTKELSIDFFDENNGYNENIIDLLNNLKIGDKLDLTDLSGTHTITRIK